MLTFAHMGDSSLRGTTSAAKELGQSSSKKACALGPNGITHLSPSPFMVTGLWSESTISQVLFKLDASALSGTNAVPAPVAARTGKTRRDTYATPDCFFI